jgi:hypothetical protein
VAERVDVLEVDGVDVADVVVAQGVALPLERLECVARDCDTSTALACQLATHGNPLLLSQLAEALDADTELPLDARRIAALGSRGRHARA